MNEAEAIDILKSKLDGHTDTSWKWAEAVRLAIKALKAQGYTEWLEEKLIETEPDILCDVVSDAVPEWCEGECDNLQSKCLRTCYEICRKEQTK